MDGFETDSDLRRFIERRTGLRLNAEQWSGVRGDKHAPYDSQDAGEVLDAVRQLPEATGRLAEAAAKVRAFLGLRSGPDTHAQVYLALHALGALDQPHAARRLGGADQAAVGRLVLACIASRRLESQLGQPPDRVLGAVLAEWDENPTEPPDPESGHGAFLQRFMEDAVGAGYKFAFPDDRRTRVSSDLRLVRAVEAIAPREPRRIAASDATTRWGYRLERFERQYSLLVGRTFRQTQIPWRSFRSAFGKSRRRLRTFTGPWPQLDRIK